MQERLIQRYLGNKSSITKEIIETIDKIASPNDLIFDAFAGTLSVTAALRKAGYRVASNDINHFTWSFATAYLTSSELPFPDAFLPVPRNSKKIAWKRLVELVVEPYSNDVPEHYRRTDIYDHYCEEGSKSAFISSRGKSGRRRFFSPGNAKVIDRVISRLRFWHQQAGLSEKTRCLLISSLLSAVEKVSNTQGTFHDFPREYVDPRSKQSLKLIAPDPTHFSGPPSKFIGKAADTLDFVNSVPRHKAIYIDPPYNFRQYTSYYFMLNLLSEYVEIDDIDNYFEKIKFVRGQNMDGDFKSPFCGKNSFLPSLKSLIEKADAEFVILSYFDGRNHWGKFKSEALELNGRALIQSIFESKMFVSGSFECIPVKRLNYQSYGGHTASKITEFLFVAQKSKMLLTKHDSGQSEWNGKGTRTLVESSPG